MMIVKAKILSSHSLLSTVAPYKPCERKNSCINYCILGTQLQVLHKVVLQERFISWISEKKTPQFWRYFWPSYIEFCPNCATLMVTVSPQGFHLIWGWMMDAQDLRGHVWTLVREQVGQGSRSETSGVLVLIVRQGWEEHCALSGSRQSRVACSLHRWSQRLIWWKGMCCLDSFRAMGVGGWGEYNSSYDDLIPWCQQAQKIVDGHKGTLKVITLNSVEKEPPHRIPTPRSTTLRACAKCHYISNGVWAALRATCLESNSSLFFLLFCFLWPHQIGPALNPFLDSEEGKGRRLAWISLGSWEKVRALS